MSRGLEYAGMCGYNNIRCMRSYRSILSIRQHRHDTWKVPYLLNLMASPVFSLLQLPVGASQSQRHTTIIWRNLKTCSAVGDIPYASRYSSALVLQYLMLYMHKILVFMLPSCLATNLWIIGWGRHLGGTTVGTHLLIL